MRLIDGDELAKNFYVPSNELFYAGTVLDYIKEAPTVDAEPLRHGKWIFNRERYSWECSECQCQTGSIFEESKSKFCKNCGAKMDGE